MTRWRNNGIESTSTAPIRMAAGLGPIKADSQLCEITQDILQRCLVRRKKGLLSIAHGWVARVVSLIRPRRVHPQMVHTPICSSLIRLITRSLCLPCSGVNL